MDTTGLPAEAVSSTPPHPQCDTTHARRGSLMSSSCGIHEATKSRSEPLSAAAGRCACAASLSDQQVTQRHSERASCSTRTSRSSSVACVPVVMYTSGRSDGVLSSQRRSGAWRGLAALRPCARALSGKRGPVMTTLGGSPAGGGGASIAQIELSRMTRSPACALAMRGRISSRMNRTASQLMWRGLRHGRQRSTAYSLGITVVIML
mmetsp:Transcript_32443/g.103456  ORF Transcript_32443/g.103456 Transcript_32443/m.103456 type:complete len:207 (+) Transcript_32443:271-891(+)